MAPGVIRALKAARAHRVGDHLEGTLDPALDGVIAQDLLEYFRHVATDGVHMGFTAARDRVRAKPRASAATNQREAYEKTWDDAREGRVLLIFAYSPGLEGVIAAPQGRVEKKNPDRTLSGEGRFVTDMRAPNLGCAKEANPPALQPRHREDAREILWWQARCPRVPVLLAAFKLIWLRVEDVALMAIELLGSWLGPGQQDVAALFLSMNFGWNGAPGEWMVWGWGPNLYTEAHRPHDPHFNDMVGYHTYVPMDDGVLVEPLLGVRPWAASATFEEGLSNLRGRGALNTKKLAEEGTFATKALLWGLGYDTQAGTCQLPEQKLLKGAHLLTQPCFDPGNRAIPLIEVQRLRGNATYWTTCQPSLKPELGAIDVLLAQTSPGDPYVCPKGDAHQATAAFQEFWDAVEVIRVLITRPETWEATFTVGLEGILNPRDRPSLPGASGRVRWVGGDATLEVAAATDWQAKVYVTFGVEPYLATLRDFTGTPDDNSTIISVAELLCLISLAAARFRDWDGRLVLYVTDNDNVRVWLSTRHARNRSARHLLRLFRYLECGVTSWWSVRTCALTTTNSRISCPAKPRRPWTLKCGA